MKKITKNKSSQKYKNITDGIALTLDTLREKKMIRV